MISKSFIHFEAVNNIIVIIFQLIKKDILTHNDRIQFVTVSFLI